jgi:AraC family transcriptional regulator of adaptative response / DNA-3-methyladenine glycosylase II
MSTTTIRLRIIGAFDWAAMLGFLARRAIAGVERVSDGTYARTVRAGEEAGTLTVTHDASTGELVARVPTPIRDEAARRLRRMFDLDADLGIVNEHLAREPFMATLVTSRPALRVPGGWDPFEIAMRSIIGQQVSVERARQLNAVLVERCSAALPRSSGGSVCRLFPAAEEVVAADLSTMGMPGARVATLKTVAAAAAVDPGLFERGASLDETIARLRRLRGIGDWTAHYIAMRACREPDAFPAGDVGLLRGAADAAGRRPTPAALLERADAWRPWRAYAAHHLWAVDSTASAGVRSPGRDARLLA